VTYGSTSSSAVNSRPGCEPTAYTSRRARGPPGTGQTLHVTEGMGLVQAEGGEVVEIRPGETVYTPPGQWHWHGAAPHHFMTHLALWEAPTDPETEETERGDLVTDDEYHTR
jgi:quercetin dioxygenase-like cupin family protein